MTETKRFYLDHAAATPVSNAVIESMRPYWGSFFANPGAIHRDGVEAKHAVDAARSTIARHLGAHPDEIIFTGSATESINLALRGVCQRFQKDHPDKTPRIIIGSTEHSAVIECANMLAVEGVEVVRVPVNPDGVIDTDALKAAITKETILVSIMYANNEIGVINPLNEIAKIVREKRREYGAVSREAIYYPYFHTDACQATNYLPLPIAKLGIDLMTINAAKIYGPKGIAALLVRRGILISPIIVGGGHEFGLRAGTENVPLIVGFASALEETILMQEREVERLAKLRDRLCTLLQMHFPEIIVNGSLRERLPNNLNVSFPNIDHEHMVLALDAKGISLSTKSACNELDADTSHVLKALQDAEKTIDQYAVRPLNGLRISLGRNTNESDIDEIIKIFIAVRKQVEPLL